MAPIFGNELCGPKEDTWKGEWHTGKLTAGLAAAQQLLSCAHWEAAYYADLSGCISPTSAAFAILSGRANFVYVSQATFAWNNGSDAKSMATSISSEGRVMPAAFGIPSESADASLLLAWLSRNVGMPAGCVLNLPPDLLESIAEHVAHLLQRLMKVMVHSDDAFESGFRVFLTSTLL